MWRSRIPVCPADGTGRISWGRVGKWLEECFTRHGSSIHGGSGHGLSRLVFVEEVWGTDPGHGEIGATMSGYTRVLTRQPGC